MIPQMSYPAVEVEMYDPNGNYIRMVTALLPSGAIYPPPPGFKFIRIVGPSPVRMSARPLPGMPMPGMPMPGMMMPIPGMPMARSMPGMPMPGMPMPGMPMPPMTGMPMPGMPMSNTTQPMTNVSKPITFRAPRSDDEIDNKKPNEKSNQKQALVSNSRQPTKEAEKKGKEFGTKGMAQSTTTAPTATIVSTAPAPVSVPMSFAKAAAKAPAVTPKKVESVTTVTAAEPEKVDSRKPESKKPESKKTEFKKVESKKSGSKNDSKAFKNDTKINFTPAEKRGQEKEITSLVTVVPASSAYPTPSAPTVAPKTSIRPRPSPPVAEKPLVIDDAFDFESLFAQEENASTLDTQAVPATSIQLAMSQRQKSTVKAANASLPGEGEEMSDAVALLVALGFDAEDNSEKSFHELLDTVQSTAQKMSQASQVDEMTQENSSDSATTSKIALFAVGNSTSKLTQKAADEKAREDEIERQAALDIQRAKEQLQAVNAVLQPRREESLAENTQHRAEKIKNLLKEQGHEISDDTIMDLVLRNDAVNESEEQRNMTEEDDVETDDLNIIDGWRFLGDAEDKVRRDAISRTAFLRRVKKARARGDDVRPIIDAEIARRNRLSGFVTPKEDQNKSAVKISQKTKQERNATKSNPFSSLAF